MRQKSERHQHDAERTIKDIRRQTRRRYSAEEKIRIVLVGLRGEDSIAEQGPTNTIQPSIGIGIERGCTDLLLRHGLPRSVRRQNI